MKRFYRVFSLFLALMLCVSLLPVGAAALDIPDMDVLQSVVEAVAESEESEQADAPELFEEVIAATVEVAEEADTLAADTFVAIDGTNFPDENFRGYVSEEFDTDNDGYLSADEIATVTRISCSYKGIATLEGVQFFTALEELWCYGNELTELDLSKNTTLRDVDCSGCGLRELKLTGLALHSLYCVDNELRDLDLSAIDLSGEHDWDTWTLNVVVCDEEAIGGIGLTETENGFVADLTAVAHLIDEKWEIGAGISEWEPTIAAAYDKETGMATFASRPAVISFGSLEEASWAARIAIYVSDADLPRLGVATDLVWGRQIMNIWDVETGGWNEIHVERPFSISWYDTIDLEDDCHRIVHFYKLNGSDVEWLEVFSTGGRAVDEGYDSGESMAEGYPETGDYYFTVQYEGDGVSWQDGDVVTSEIFSYTKPDESLETCTDITWSEDGLPTWSGPENEDYFNYYQLGVCYSETAEGESYGHSYSDVGYGENVDSYMKHCLEVNGSGYYYFNVRSISTDITKSCNSEWSEFSEWRYFWVENGDHTEDLPVGDMDGDGYVLANDLVSLMKDLVSGEIEAATNPDINEDGNVDILDVIRLVRIMAGLA